MEQTNMNETINGTDNKPVCPFRTDILYVYGKNGQLQGEFEEFSDCDTFNCPFWDAIECGRARQLLEQ